MSTLEKNLYDRIAIKPSGQQKPVVTSKAYRGLSTVNPDNNSSTLFDLGLIKQDLLNHFHIRQGEKLHNPEFGTIIWDAIFEPFTDDLKEAIATNVTKIVNYDPRIQADNISVSSYESGIQIELELTYLPYNISEKLRLDFDETAGLTA
jgi:phage baseplate assembly protein W|tara:strand:+ start:8599 stop:9045 length:447 start_codon:yes stop_codon:yes gene_type:complete